MTNESHVLFQVNFEKSFDVLEIGKPLIYDYADSHKNDIWQRYAAATAAAYTKEFLAIVPVDDIDKTPKALDVLEDS